VTESSASIAVGIVVERQSVAHRWAQERWRPVDVLPGAPPATWRELARGEGWARYHAATLPLELHRTETEHYRYNLSGEPPMLYVVMRPAEGEFPLLPVEVSASPFESLAHTEFGDDKVEPVPMPPAVIAWVQEYIERHHVEQPFYKRKRKGLDKAAGETSDFVRVGEATPDE
jgi:hypothetical protein